tara:strand:+ start:4329 stop:4682 length:354 start_codon:yes stop_codon:yes gene_type:complete
MQGIENITVGSILDYITVGVAIAILIGAYKLYHYVRKSAIKETESKELVIKIQKEIKDLKDDSEKTQIQNELKMKEILIRVDNDKDSILKKVEEIDVKSEARFNDLTKLIIDLFKQK